ncbi:hypothetical protein EIP86_002630 [Pleurotus ostreatoroseus]|nr:hypothetical protein EIP86_002630 [Pleurotus ostreatoroseus]
MKKASTFSSANPKTNGLTMEERDAFKEKIRAEMNYHNIRLYPFDTEENDKDEVQLNESISNVILLAVIGSERTAITGGKIVRGRQARWGVVNVEDEKHCKFVHLRDFLMRTHLQDLIVTTVQILYEAFRSGKLLAPKGQTNRPAP